MVSDLTSATTGSGGWAFKTARRNKDGFLYLRICQLVYCQSAAREDNYKNKGKKLFIILFEPADEFESISLFGHANSCCLCYIDVFYVPYELLALF